MYSHIKFFEVILLIMFYSPSAPLSVGNQARSEVQ